MKKIITRICLCLGLFCGLNSTVFAQRNNGNQYNRPYSHGNSGDGFYRTVRVIEGIAETASFARTLHMIADYTSIRVGYNAASFRLSGFDNADLDSSTKPGLNVGLAFGWNLGHSGFAIEPGFMYTMKGGEIRGKNYVYGYTDLSTIKTTMHLIEIPLVVKYNIPLSQSGCNLQPFFGGFLSFGLGGKSKDSENHESYETFGDNTDQFDAVDAGLRAGVGLNINYLYMELAYDFGLVNLPNNEYRNWGYDNGFDDAIHSKCLSLNIGFNF